MIRAPRHVTRISTSTRGHRSRGRVPRAKKAARALGLVVLAAWLAGGPASADHHEDALPPSRPDAVARAQFTSAITDREPVDDLSHVPSDVGQVTFFTEVRDLAGATVIHRWKWSGKLMAEVAFEVRGPRWRVWSTKEILPRWLGEWTVTVVDGGGAQLAERKLQVAEAAASGEPAPADDQPAEAPEADAEEM